MPPRTTAAGLDSTTSGRGSETKLHASSRTAPDSWDTPKPSWLARKQAAYIQRARTLPSPSLRVSIADKVHNTYGILRDLRNIGEKVWERYDVSADDVLAYYESLVRAYREAGGGRLVDEARADRPWNPARDGILRPGEVRAGKQIRSRPGLGPRGAR